MREMRKSMGSKIIIFLKEKSKAGKIMVCGRNKKKSKAKHKANFCLVYIFF